jgi:hypothetical protein
VIGAEFFSGIRSTKNWLEIIAQAPLEIGHAATLSAHSRALLNGKPTWTMLPATS